MFNSTRIRERMVRRLALTGLAVLTGLGLGAAVAAPASAADDGTVYVVHGVPGLTVDVYVNGQPALTAFEPGAAAGPLSLPAGTYDVAIRTAGDPTSATPAIQKSVDLPAGANATLVAHLDAAGSPVLTAFANPVTGLESGKGRLVVRHTAAAPAVDVLAGGQPVFTDVVNGQEKTADLAPGTVPAAVALAGTTQPVLGPADVTLEAGKLTTVYAIGSATDGTLQLVTQSVPAAAAAPAAAPAVPAGANAGDGGLAADSTSTWPALALALGGIALLSAGGVAVARARR